MFDIQFITGRANRSVGGYHRYKTGRKKFALPLDKISPSANRDISIVADCVADGVADCSGIELAEMRFTRLVTVVVPQRASRDSNPKPSDP